MAEILILIVGNENSFCATHIPALPTSGGGYSTALSACYDGWAGLYDEHGQHTIVLIEYD